MGNDAPNTIYLDADLGDCGCKGTHVRRPLGPFAVAPQTDSQFNAILLPPEPIACWRMDDARFDFDSSFIVPAAKKEFGLLRTVVHENTGAPLSVFGHADPTGSDDYNKKLSGRRALVVYAALIRNTQAWEQLYSNPMEGDRWDDGQITDMLSALPPGNQARYLQSGDQISEGLTRFQQANNVAPSGSNDASTRAILFRQYMDYLCNGDTDNAADKLQLTAGNFLGAGASKTGKGDYQGCSRFNPVLVFSQAEDETYSKPQNHQKRDSENAPNRRVTIFLFKPGTKIDPAKWPCPAAQDPIQGCVVRFFPDGNARRNPSTTRRLFDDTKRTFACRFYQRLAGNSPCEGSNRMVVFRVRLCDFERNPIPLAPCRIVQAGQHFAATADENGFVLVVARQRPEELRLEWTTPEQSDQQPYPFRRIAYVAPGQDDTGGFERLHNVGFTAAQRLEGRVEEYQKYFGHPLTGRLADIRGELDAWHDGGPKPLIADS